VSGWEAPGTALLGRPFDEFLATAEAVARARPEVDVDLAREVFLEAATLLHDPEGVSAAYLMAAATLQL
jgi:hypothetical protein